MSGTGSLTKNGAGTLVLAGSNSFTGTTQVNTGTLRINGNQVSATGAVTVASGATLGGSGTVGGAITLLSGATIAVGNSPGIFTAANALHYNSGSSFQWGLISNVDAANDRGTQYDGINVSNGSLTITSGATLNLVFNGTGSSVLWSDAFWDSNHSWTIIAPTGSTSINPATAGGFNLNSVSNDSGGNALAVSLGRFVVETTTSGVVLNYISEIPDATTSTVSASTTSLTADGTSTSTLTAQLKNAADQNVTVGGATVSFGLSPNVGSIGTVTDNNNGTYTATYTAGTTAGSVTITPSVGGTAFSNTTAITLTSGSASSVSVSAGNNQSATAGTSVINAPTVRVTDAYNNPVSGVSVNFAVATGGGSLTGASIATDSNGLASVGSWTLGTLAGSNTLTATVTGLTPVTFTATATASTPSTSANGTKVVASPTSVEANNSLTSTLTATLQDQYGNIATDSVAHTIDFTSPLIGSTLSASSCIITASQSTCTVTVKSTAAGTDAITATDTRAGGSATALSNMSQATVTFTAGPISVGAAGTQLSGTDLSRKADGIEAATIQVQLRDANGNAIAQSGVGVTFSSTGGTLSSTSAVSTDSAGVAAVTLTSTTVGSVDVTASVASAGAVIHGSPVTVTFTAATASKLVIGGSTSQTAGVAQSLIVTAKDAQGNTATSYTGDKSLTFSGATASSAPVTAPTVTDKNGTAIDFGTATTLTFTNGVATVSGASNGLMTLYKVESATISVTDGSLSCSGSDCLSVSVDHAAASQLAFTTQPAASTIAGVGLNPQPAVTVQDAYGNAVSTGADASASVALTLTQGTGTLSGTATQSASAGVAGYSGLSINLAGNDKQLTATATLAGTQKTATSSSFAITAGTASQLAITSAAATTTAGSCNALTVETQDSNGNAANPGSDVTLTPSSSSADASFYGDSNCTIALATATIVTSTDTATLYWKDTLAGSPTLTVTASGGITSAPTQGQTVQADTASQLVLSTIGNQTAGSAFGVTVTLADANGNAVTNTGADSTITLSIKTGTGTLGGTVSGTQMVGQSAITISGVTYSKAETGVELTATGSVGGLANGKTGDSNSFDVSATTPGAPGTPAASAGNRQVSLNWAAPTELGGTPILGYAVTGMPSGSCTTTGATSCVITGLTNGMAYTFTVVARNAQGAGASSNASVPVMPLSGVAPMLFSVSPNSGPQLGGTAVTLVGTGLSGATTVRFGNVAAQSYQVVSENEITAVTPAQAGGAMAVSVTTPLGTGSLPNGFIYAAAPAQPGVPIAAPGTQQATVSWVQVFSGGGNPDSYTVTASPGGRTCSVTFPGNAFPYASCVVTGLTNGVAYTFTVTASNGLGSSTSPVSSPAMPLAVINGSCGAANGIPTMVEPQGFLCSAGTASAVTNSDGTFNWRCHGQNDGSTQQCSAPGISSQTDQQTPSTVTLTSDAESNGCALQSARLTSPPAQGPGNNVTMSYGAVSFEMVNCSQPSTGPAQVRVRLSYADIVEGMQYWKYVVNTYHNGWVQLPSNEVTLSGNTAEFTIVDNGEWDNDPVIGAIADPGGPGYDPNALAAPGQPGNVRVNAGNQSATVSWSAPTTGGQPVLYRVDAQVNGTATGFYCEALYPATQCMVQGLTNGQAYTFQVTANNAAGGGPPVVDPTPVVPNPPSPPPPNPIPILDESGLISMATLLAALGAWRNRRSRRSDRESA